MMLRTRHTRRRAGNRPGFSLVEVMMATAILGLGVLGLLALFAGTARQQQIASQATNDLLIRGNAQSLIGPEVGRLTDADQDPTTGPLDDLDEGVWYPMTAENDAMSEGRLLAPRASAGGSDDLFFLADANVPGSEFVIYSASEDEWANGQSAGLCGGSIGQFQAESFDFPGARLHPCSLRRIDVEIVERNPSTNEVTPLDTISYNLTFFGNSDTYGSTAYYVGDSHVFSTFSPDGTGPCGEDRWTSSPAPSCQPTDDFIKINLVDDPTNNPVPGRTRAFIEQMQLRPLTDIANFYPMSVTNPANVFVKSITVQTPFQFRRSDIISPGSRFQNTINSRGERVPELGYSLLFRLTDDGSTEVMIATYAITQTESGTTFVPKEDFDAVLGGDLDGGEDSDGPLKKIEDVTLGFDQDEERHYIEIGGTDNLDENGWVMEPGTFVLVQGDEMLPGSELSTEVISQEVQDDGRLRGFLDRAPRNRGSILLEDLGETEDTSVWAVQPTVESEEGGSVWRLRGIGIETVFINEVQ